MPESLLRHVQAFAGSAPSALLAASNLAATAAVTVTWQQLKPELPRRAADCGLGDSQST